MARCAADTVRRTRGGQALLFQVRMTDEAGTVVGLCFVADRDEAWGPSSFLFDKWVGLFFFFSGFQEKWSGDVLSSSKRGAVASL